MKKFSFKAVALAASFVASGAAFAANQDLDATAANATPAAYASEIKIDATNGTALTAGAAATLATDVKLGASFGSGVTAYVRFDLSSGVFTADPAYTILDSTPAAASVSVAQGGAGASYVIFAVAPAATKNLVGTNAGTFTPAGYTVKDQNAISLTYRLFETLTAAANPTSTNTLKTAANAHVKYKAALSTKFTPVTNTADVGAATGSYTDFTTPGTAKLSTIATTVDNTVAVASGAAAALATLVQDKTKVTATGDFTATQTAAVTTYDKTKVFLSTSATCAAASKTADSLSATTATFGNASTTITAANWATYVALCYVPSTEVAIAAGDYSADVAYTAQANYTVGNSTGNAAGSIVRNGATLVAPITNQPAGWYSRLVLTNAGSADRTYSVKAVSETGNVVTLTGAAASGTLTKNSTSVIELGDLATVTAGKRYSLVVTVNGPVSAISGAYQSSNGATGSISNYTLVQK
jgi:hypothetical protein